MKPLTISNNVIIISNPNELFSLKEIIKEVTSNNLRTGENYVIQGPQNSESVFINNAYRDVYDGPKLWEPVNFNNEINSGDQMLNGRRMDIGYARYRRSKMFDYLPQREVYVFKTDCEKMIYYHYEKLSEFSTLINYMAYEALEWGKSEYYVLVKFSCPKKLCPNEFIYFEPINMPFTFDKAISYIKYRAVPFFIPKETLNHRQINKGYPQEEKERKRRLEFEDVISIDDDIFSEDNSQENFVNKKIGEDNAGKMLFDKDCTSTRANSPVKVPSENYTQNYPNKERKERSELAELFDAQRKEPEAQKKVLLNRKKYSNVRESDDDESVDDEENPEKKNGPSMNKGDGIQLEEEEKSIKYGSNEQKKRIDNNIYGKKKIYF